MSKIKVNDLIKDFRRMAEEHWAYEAGAEEEYAVDCSGAFVWAYRQHGKSIPHGSNRIARTAVTGLHLVAEGNVQPGMAAFKGRYPGEAGYDLPGAYQPGGAYHDGDAVDYYHIGLVAEDGKHVLNARSTADGFVVSDIREGWSFVGFLNDVDYGEEPVEPEPVPDPEPAAEEYRVTGGRLNLRSKPEKHAPAIRSLADGEIVTRIAMDGEWMKVKAGRETGYAMAQYLEPVGGDSGGAVVVPGDAGGEYITVPKEAWEALKTAFDVFADASVAAGVLSDE